MSVQMGLMVGFLHDGIRITVRATPFFNLNEQSWRGVLVVVRLLVLVDYVRKEERLCRLCFLLPFTPSTSEILEKYELSTEGWISNT